jgi:hypothetical protein
MICIESNLELKLTRMPQTVIQTPTIEIFNTLMNLYKAAGWMWYAGNDPEPNFGFIYGSRTGVLVNEIFSVSNINSNDYLKRINKKTHDISFLEFLDAQRIDTETFFEYVWKV